jgi:uncharacterized membrane protein
MSDLIVVGFKDEFKADEVMNELRKLQSQYLVEIKKAKSKSNKLKNS